jgi:hypothetical protein
MSKAPQSKRLPFLIMPKTRYYRPDPQPHAKTCDCASCGAYHKVIGQMHLKEDNRNKLKQLGLLAGPIVRIGSQEEREKKEVQ